MSASPAAVSRRMTVRLRLTLLYGGLFFAAGFLLLSVAYILVTNILESLLTLREEVTIDPALAARARRSVERMINLKN